MNRVASGFQIDMEKRSLLIHRPERFSWRTDEPFAFAGLSDLWVGETKKAPPGSRRLGVGRPQTQPGRCSEGDPEPEAWCAKTPADGRSAGAIARRDPW